MKILHLAQRYAPVGGVETYLLSLLPLLQANGHENVLIYREHHSCSPLSAGHAVHHVPKTAEPQHDRAKIVDIIQKNQPSIIYLHDVYDPELILEASRLAPTIGYVHIFYPVCPGLGKLFMRNDHICTKPYGLGCVPQIYLRRCASARHPRSVYRIMKQTRRFLTAYNSLAKVIVASRYMKQLMIQNGLAGDRVEVLPLFVPIPDDSEIPAPHAEPEVPSIMYAGRLEYEKGVPYLLRALREIKSPCCLLIAGDGSLKPQYVKMAHDLGLSDRVRFTGWLADPDLQEAYRRCAVIVMPTIMPEPFGKVGLEAMANGRPVVAFDVGGIPDWLKDGHNGFLVPPRDIKQLAARIGQLLIDRELAAELGANGRRFVEENFTDDRHMERLMQIFQQTISEQRFHESIVDGERH